MPYRTRLFASLQALNSVGSEIRVLREGLHLLHRQKFNYALLTRLAESCGQLNIGQLGAPAAIRKLERLISVLTQRNKEWFYAVSRGLLVGTQAFWAIEEWRSKYSEALIIWLSVWGQFEALAALACYAHEHPDNTFPRLLEDEVALDAKGIGHPLLPVDICVRNDLSLNGHTRFYVVSGSNMAGKSTLIRAIGLNAILAYSGAPVCAQAMSLSLFSVCAAISIQDSLLNGRSKFLAEIDRLRYALNLTGAKKPVLFLIDEPLSGTNSRNRDPDTAEILA
jgi:DNA mismatch repair ATPase MutS